MIHPDAKIRWINTSSGNGIQVTSIETLFSQFIMHSIKVDDKPTRVIHFYDGLSHIKIHDMLGYTSIVSIIRSTMTSHWVNITNVNNLKISDCCLIPVYDINKDPYIGFHGEVKRHYILKHPEKMTETDRIRIYDEINKVDNYISPDINSDDDSKPYGYYIITESRFCTVNGVHMFASDNITTDEAKCWV